MRSIATGPAQTETIPGFFSALKEFSSLVESENNLFEYKLQEGECVIFNNRRVLHGRRQFDTETGMRWLKGAYVDTDVFMSRWRVLAEKFGWVDNRLWKEVGVQRLVNEAKAVEKSI